MIDMAEYNPSMMEEDAVRKVYKLINDGGSHSHNLICMLLGNIAIMNGPLAEAVHDDIQELGY